MHRNTTYPTTKASGQFGNTRLLYNNTLSYSRRLVKCFKVDIYVEIILYIGRENNVINIFQVQSCLMNVNAGVAVFKTKAASISNVS